jgi:hypothetical protein
MFNNTAGYLTMLLVLELLVMFFIVDVAEVK